MLVQTNNQTSFEKLSNKIDFPSTDTPSLCRGYVSSFVSSIGKVANYIFTPEKNPTWNQALMKTGLGFIGLFGMEKFSNAYLY